MPILRINPVAIFRARYFGMEISKNPEYFFLLLKHEYDQAGDFKPEKYLQSSDDLALFEKLQQGHDYYFRCAVSINDGNESNGRKYRPRLNLKVLEVRPTQPQALAV